MATKLVGLDRPTPKCLSRAGIGADLGPGAAVGRYAGATPRDPASVIHHQDLQPLMTASPCPGAASVRQ